MSLIGLVRKPGGARASNGSTALEQHANYVGALREMDVRVLEVASAPELADAVFIQDTALVIDSMAVIARSGSPAQRADTAAVVEPLSRFCHLVQPPPFARFDGSDALVIDRTVYVGRTEYTNEVAIEYLTILLRQHRYEVVPVPVLGGVHLRSAATDLGHDRVLINPAWVPKAIFAKYTHVEVDPTEPWGASAMRVGPELLMSATAPKTAKTVAHLGFKPKLIDVSEFHRARGGVSGLSIILAARAPTQAAHRSTNGR